MKNLRFYDILQIMEKKKIINYYTMHYDSPIGGLVLAATQSHLIGLWMEGQKYFAVTLPQEHVHNTPVPPLVQTAAWLDAYFAGERPGIDALPLAPIGGEFRQQVWQILCEIPYGALMTYGQIAQELKKRAGRQSMSAQAVGGAVGHNPISIIIPCHRVVGSNGSLTGYAGGIDKKRWLLEHEGADMQRLYMPTKGTAL